MIDNLSKEQTMPFRSARISLLVRVKLELFMYLVILEVILSIHFCHLNTISVNIGPNSLLWPLRINKFVSLILIHVLSQVILCLLEELVDFLKEMLPRWPLTLKKCIILSISTVIYFVATNMLYKTSLGPWKSKQRMNKWEKLILSWFDSSKKRALFGLFLQV